MASNISQQTEVNYEKNIPSIVMLTLFVVIGIVGNSLTLYIYGFCFKVSTTRVFILGLAIFDLITCVLLPYKIILLRYGSLFTNPHINRFEMVRVYFLQVSVMVIPLVSVDRYRRICQPFKRQISPGLAKVLIVVMCIIVAGVTTFRIVVSSEQDGKQYKTEAFVSPKYIKKRFSDTSLSMFYFVYTIIHFCLPIPIMMILYSLIGLKIRKLSKSRFQTPRADVISSDDMILHADDNVHRSQDDIADTSIRGENCGAANSTVIELECQETVTKKVVFEEGDASVKTELQIEILEESQIHKGDKRYRPTHIMVKRNSTNDSQRNLSTSEVSNTENSSLELKSQDTNRRAVDLTTKSKSRCTLRWKRMTLIFFLITVVYCVTFLPPITFSIIFRVNKFYAAELLSKKLFILLYNFGYISNMSNCFVYGFFDPRFQSELKRLSVIFRRFNVKMC